MTDKQLEPWKGAMVAAQDRFTEIASKDQIVDWQRESMFALQAIEKSDYLRRIANDNPASLRNAIINVAAIGITLNPAAQYAALVPRDGAVCLDIMYRGLIKIATDAGSVRWVQAEVVHEADEFTFTGKVSAPIHKANVFAKDRGPIVGVYCVAKTVDGDFLTEVMSIDEVNAIRDRSDYWKKKKAGPWLTDPGEMAKKTIIKRARKTWPETDARSAERLQTATELANEADGYHLEALEHKPDAKILPSAGAAEAVGREMCIILQEYAAEIDRIFADGGAPAAFSHMESLGIDDVDQNVYLWSRLDSKTRTALRKFDNETRRAKNIAAMHAGAARA